MNKIVSKLYIALLATLVTLLSACTPETYELGSQDIVSDDLAEGIAFSITHDAVNPNIVYLTSNPQLSSSASFLRLNVLSSLN